MLEATLLSRLGEDICLKFQPTNHKYVYLCDCGAASDLTIKDCHDLGALFVSHTHIDHFCNFDGIFRHQLAVGRGIVVCGPPGIARNVSNKLNGYIWNLMYDDKAVYYEVREIESPGVVAVYHLRVPTWEPVLQERIETDVVYANDAFSAKYAMLDHGTPSIAYRFEEPSKLKIGKFEQRPGPWIAALKDAFLAKDGERVLDIHGEQVEAGELFELLFEEKGDSVGYAMDHAATEENHALIEELMNEVGHLFIECYYHDEDKELAEANRHSTSTASGQAARRARAQKATPCHFSRRYNDSIDEVRAAFEAAFLGEE